MGSRFLRDRRRTVAGSDENQASLFQPELWQKDNIFEDYNTVYSLNDICVLYLC